MEYAPAPHDERDTPNRRDVPAGIAVDRDDVGVVAWRERPDGIAQIEGLGCQRRRARQRVHRLLAERLYPTLRIPVRVFERVVTRLTHAA